MEYLDIQQNLFHSYILNKYIRECIFSIYLKHLNLNQIILSIESHQFQKYNGLNRLIHVNRWRRDILEIYKFIVCIIKSRKYYSLRDDTTVIALKNTVLSYIIDYYIFSMYINIQKYFKVLQRMNYPCTLYELAIRNTDFYSIGPEFSARLLERIDPINPVFSKYYYCNFVDIGAAYLNNVINWINKNVYKRDNHMRTCSRIKSDSICEVSGMDNRRPSPLHSQERLVCLDQTEEQLTCLERRRSEDHDRSIERDSLSLYSGISISRADHDNILTQNISYIRREFTTNEITTNEILKQSIESYIEFILAYMIKEFNKITSFDIPKSEIEYIYIL